MSNKIDITGQRFGKLTAIEPTENRKRGLIIWKFKCDCGNIFYCPASYVKNGNTKSCGCNKYIGLKRKNKTASEKAKICIGTKFGRLTVIEDLGVIKKDNKCGRRYYKCKCDCGNIIKITGNRLKQGTSSCGCLNSKGEEKIIKILNNNNITYEHDKTLKELIDFTNGRKLRFDFIIYNNEYKNNIVRIIEFDGKQHFQGMDGGIWKNLVSLDEIKERDELKNKFCIKYNIPLVRIPYYKLKTLVLEDLIGDKYLIKEGDNNVTK